MQGLITVVLLIISNIFMTFAWYGHLRFKMSPLWEAVLVSWLIASFEYCFQVPANRIGSYIFSTAQLKIIQEVITLIVFSGFSIFYLKEQLRWNYVIAFMCMIAAVFFVFLDFKNSRTNHSLSTSSQSTKTDLLVCNQPEENEYARTETSKYLSR